MSMARVLSLENIFLPRPTLLVERTGLKHDVDDSAWMGISIYYTGLHLPLRHQGPPSMLEHEVYLWGKQLWSVFAKVPRVSDTLRSRKQEMRDVVRRSRYSCLSFAGDNDLVDYQNMLAIVDPSQACLGESRVQRFQRYCNRLAKALKAEVEGVSL